MHVVHEPLPHSFAMSKFNMATLDTPVWKIRSSEEARSLLAQLQQQEDELGQELDVLLEQQTQMDIKMAAFQQMLPNLKTLHGDSQELSSAIARASELAESVSSKVRVLDLAKGHVYAAMKRVDDVIDLKSCVEGVQHSMNTGDYEKAAAHIHRYLTLDESILLETTADKSKGSSTVSTSFALLRQAELQLKDLVRKKFAEAVQEGNTQDVERFFKIFPLLNLHEEGLTRFSEYLNGLIEATSQQNLQSAAQDTGGRAGVVYADTLTLLFEGIARTIEKNQPMVETYYGPNWTLFLVKKLQLECDRQVEKVVNQLQEERLLDHKVRALTLQLQTISIAMKSRSTAGAIRPDVLELDTLLSELSMCSARTELYFRFLQRKAAAPERVSDNKTTPPESDSVITELIKNSITSLSIQELIGKYIVIENYFMRESLAKAVSMDSYSADGLTSSMADDIFFVLQKCIRRAFGSSNVDGACAMLNHASTLLLTDYRDVLQSKLKASLPSTGLDFSGMIQSKLQATRSAGTDSEAGKTTSMIAVNDIEVSIENVQKLTKELQAEYSKLLGHATGEASKRKLDSCLADLSSIGTNNFKQLRQSGISKVLELIIIPRIKPTVEVFSAMNHVLSEDDLANFEVNDPFVQQLIATTENVLTDIKGKFLQPVYDQVLNELTGEIAFLLEQQVFNCSFNQLGGVQLDKDLRLLVGYLSSQTQWPVRDKFARLLQMATILNLETAIEILEYWGANAGPMMWRLTPTEVRKVLHLRNDFKEEDIEKIRL